MPEIVFYLPGTSSVDSTKVRKEYEVEDFEKSSIDSARQQFLLDFSNNWRVSTENKVKFDKVFSIRSYLKGGSTIKAYSKTFKLWDSVEETRAVNLRSIGFPIRRIASLLSRSYSSIVTKLHRLKK